MTTINVKYVGNKDLKTDNVAGTGHAWRRGEVRAVEAGKAALLIAHPDVWVATTERETTNSAATEASLQSEAAGLRSKEPEEELEQDHEPLTATNLEAMKRPELISYAKQKYNVDLAENLRKADLVARVNDLQRANTPQRRLR